MAAFAHALEGNLDTTMRSGWPTREDSGRCELLDLVIGSRARPAGTLLRWQTSTKQAMSGCRTLCYAGCVRVCPSVVRSASEELPLDEKCT